LKPKDHTLHQSCRTDCSGHGLFNSITIRP